MSVEGDDFVENAVRAVEMSTTNVHCIVNETVLEWYCLCTLSKVQKIGVT